MENTLTTKDYIILDLMKDENITDYEFLTQYGEMYDKLNNLRKEVKDKQFNSIKQLHTFIGAASMAIKLLNLKNVTYSFCSEFCFFELVDENNYKIVLKHSQMFDRGDLQSYNYNELNEAILSQLNNIDNWAEGNATLPFIQYNDDFKNGFEVVPENFDVYKK